MCENLPQGVKIMYRTDGNLLNINRFWAKRKTSTTSVMEWQYVDDNALVSHSEEDLQCIMDAFGKAYKQLGLALNIEKTQILYHPAINQNTTFMPPAIHVDKTKLDIVEHKSFHTLAAFSPPKPTVTLK